MCNVAPSIQAFALTLSGAIPELSDLNREQLETVARAVIAQRLTEDLAGEVARAGIDWGEEREKWLSDTKSTHTLQAYAESVQRFEQWASKEGRAPLATGPEQADDFIRSLRASGRAPASIRRDISALSAFFSHLERYFSAIKNPFRGTRLLPKVKQQDRPLPSPAEVSFLLQTLNPYERAILAPLALRGLRIGALPTLTGRGGVYRGESKGRPLKATLPPAAMQAFEEAGLNLRAPFAGASTKALARRLVYYTEKLANSGSISARYSPHDFRHFFAVQEYGRDRDIYRVSKLLNHANLAITQTYLRGLGIEV